MIARPDTGFHEQCWRAHFRFNAWRGDLLPFRDHGMHPLEAQEDFHLEILQQPKNRIARDPECWRKRPTFHKFNTFDRASLATGDVCGEFWAGHQGQRKHRSVMTDATDATDATLALRTRAFNVCTASFRLCSALCRI